MRCLYNSLSGPFERFSLNFTQGHGHTSLLWDYLPFNFVSISSEPFERFKVNFTQMSLLVRRCAESMNRVCRLKVKVNFQGHGIYPIQFPVRSISPKAFERFAFNFTQMFLSARRCAENMFQLWRLKVNVTVQGYGIYL